MESWERKGCGARVQLGTGKAGNLSRGRRLGLEVGSQLEWEGRTSSGSAGPAEAGAGS